MAGSKRAHPMQAKYLLARTALQDAPWFFETFGGADGSGCLTRFWDLVGSELPEQERVEARGLATQGTRLDDGSPALLLSLPAPDRNDAHFVAAVAGRAGVRVFCLERSLSVRDQSECTVIAELAADHRANWGSGPAADAAAFLAAVEAIVSGAQPGPMATVPMRLA